MHVLDSPGLMAFYFSLSYSNPFCIPFPFVFFYIYLLFLSSLSHTVLSAVSIFPWTPNYVFLLFYTNVSVKQFFFLFHLKFFQLPFHILIALPFYYPILSYLSSQNSIVKTMITFWGKTSLSHQDVVPNTILFFQKYFINGIMQYITFWDQIFFLSIIIWRHIQIVVSKINSSLLMSGMSRYGRTYPLKNIRGFFFQYLVITNKDVINICIHVFLYEPLRKYPQKQLLYCMVVAYLAFLL